MTAKGKSQKSVHSVCAFSLHCFSSLLPPFSAPLSVHFYGISVSDCFGWEPVASCPLPCHKLNRLEALFKIQSNGICNTNRQARIRGSTPGREWVWLWGILVAEANLIFSCSIGQTPSPLSRLLPWPAGQCAMA